MAFQENIKQKGITSLLFATFFIGLMLVIGLLIFQSTKLSQVMGSRVVAIGPLHLLELQKTPIDNGGFTVTFQLLAGMFSYLELLLAIGLTLGYFRFRSKG